MKLSSVVSLMPVSFFKKKSNLIYLGQFLSIRMNNTDKVLECMQLRMVITQGQMMNK